jgi:hypothetical protein
VPEKALKGLIRHFTACLCNLPARTREPCKAPKKQKRQKDLGKDSFLAQVKLLKGPENRRLEDF